MPILQRQIDMPQKGLVIHLLLIFLLTACSQAQVNLPTLHLGTTTSTYDSGLLDVILPEFEREFQVEVAVIAVGTGQAIALGERGDVDIVFVHAPELEEKFVEEGYGIDRTPVMYNDFIFVGPKNDPAGIATAGDSASVLLRIAETQSSFVSRGDNSGTHNKELTLWDLAGIVPDSEADWYYSIGQGMGSTLNLSNQQSAYTLTDRGTFLAQQESLPNLEILFGGEGIETNPDANLLNYYSVIPINPDNHADINVEHADLFVEWITSIPIQEIIISFGIEQFGQPLFYPNSEEWRASSIENTIPEQSIVEVEDSNSGLWEGLKIIFQGDSRFLEIILMTLRVSGSALVLACLFGIPLGLFLGLSNFPGKRYLKLVVNTGMGMPPVVVGLIVFLLLSKGGPLGILNWLFTPTGMILAQTVLAFPLAAGLTSTAVAAVPEGLIIQIRSLGATRKQEYWTIFIQARRGVLAAVLAALGRIISEVGAVMLVGGNIAGRTRVLSTAIVLETRQGVFDLALALSLVLLGIALISNSFALRYEGRWVQ